MNIDYQILVPRYVDASNTNAQNLNAKALLSRFKSPRARWLTAHYHSPEEGVVLSPQVRVKKLWRTRLWQWHAAMLYQQKVDAIFYPGMDWFDSLGLSIRKRSGRRVPVIGTLEGLAGDERREKELEATAGHRVFCDRVGREVIDRCDRILHSCDHIIAITPMLAKLGKELYGDKFSVLPLGIDTEIFHPRDRSKSEKFRVIGVGSVRGTKRPEVFVELAKHFTCAEFVWFGQGPQLTGVRAKALSLHLENLEFAGAVSPEVLAENFRRSDLFVLPSWSEGAPKVLQEAAACGLPRIAFGFYEPPIIDGVDGHVVWNDDELFLRVSDLISNRKRTVVMGTMASSVAGKSDWSNIAPVWESALFDQIERLSSL